MKNKEAGQEILLSGSELSGMCEVLDLSSSTGERREKREGGGGGLCRSCRSSSHCSYLTLILKIRKCVVL